ncbi:hypothetical protein BH23VER1_BH23VER1_18410 [soil metagenome]
MEKGKRELDSLTRKGIGDGSRLVAEWGGWGLGGGEMNWVVVLVMLGALGVPVFVVPGERERVEALGEVSGMSGEWRRALGDGGGDFAPVPAPGEGDWLGERQELGQTFEDFLRSPRNVLVPRRRTVYLLPLGTGEDLDDAGIVLSRFLRLRVKVLAPVSLEELGAPWRAVPGGVRQFKVEGVADALRRHVPADALGLIAVTGADLYRHGPGSFTYGYSRPLGRVAVVGLHRFADADEVVERRRFLATLIHEGAHLLGIRHCIYYACLMNGSMGVAESDRRPLHLCPVCLRKLGVCVRFSPVRRYRDLEVSFRKRGLEEEAEWVGRRLARLAAPE